MPDFDNSCRGRDAERCYSALRARQFAVDRGVVGMTIGELAARLHRSTRYVRSITEGRGDVFFVEDSKRMVRDRLVELRSE